MNERWEQETCVLGEAEKRSKADPSKPMRRFCGALEDLLPSCACAGCRHPVRAGHHQGLEKNLSGNACVCPRPGRQLRARIKERPQCS